MIVNKMIAVAGAAMLLVSGLSFAEGLETAVAEEVIADSEAAEADTLIYAVRLRIPYGLSVWTADLNKSWTANPVKIRYLVEPSCRSPLLALSLRSSVDGTWQRTTRVDQIDAHSLSSFDGIKFELDSSAVVATSCEFLLYGAESTDNPDNPDSNWGTGVLTGGAEYLGGFAHNLEVAVSANRRIKGFRLAIPEFCSGAEILEAGTVSEGVFDPATLFDGGKSIYRVIGGAVRTSTIRFSVNGPFDSRCFIPVYVYSAD